MNFRIEVDDSPCRLDESSATTVRFQLKRQTRYQETMAGSGIWRGSYARRPDICRTFRSDFVVPPLLRLLRASPLDGYFRESTGRSRYDCTVRRVGALLLCKKRIPEDRRRHNNTDYTETICVRFFLPPPARFVRTFSAVNAVMRSSRIFA